jgi:hypothetical protein
LSGLELGIDQVAVDAQLEATALGRDERERLNLLFVRGQQLARQTDGLRLVVSHRTVHEFNIHPYSPSESVWVTIPIVTWRQD